MPDTIVRVAIPSPLSRIFDYRLPSDFAAPACGMRVIVPFGRKLLVGVVLGCSESSEIPSNKLRDLVSVLDETPILEEKIVRLLKWASQYYVYPVGEVFSTALPALLRQEVPAELPVEIYYRPTELADVDAKSLNRAKLQRQVLMKLQNAPTQAMDATQLAETFSGWRAAIKGLIEKGFVAAERRQWCPVKNTASESPPELHDEQKVAVSAVLNRERAFRAFLLNGVTGSGKTEVYLRLIEQMSIEGKQSLVMVPEISLTPQLLDRFKNRLSCSMVILHSGMNDKQRAANWLTASQGDADVVIGTRSSVFTPLPKVGLIIVDEEHDASLKQQDRFRYNARDLALVRARDANIPIVLGSATPSLESLYNVEQKRFTELRLRHRAGNARPPKIGLLDVRRRKMDDGLSQLLLKEVERHRNDGGQVLIFINRRGFAPILICADCGATSDCRRCDAHMTVHAASNRLRCHHCGSERPIPSSCESCNSEEFDRVGQGSERIEAALNEHFPDAKIVRIDRDTTRRKGALEKHLHSAHSGEADILVGTQMLAKGHHFPNVTLVGILDADRGLFGTDFRSLEQMGQLVTQVAGRSGRAEKLGEVLIQTRNPDHELLRLLISKGYEEFSRAALRERRDAELPPYTHVALLRAESPNRNESKSFLRYVSDMIKQIMTAQIPGSGILVFGPVVAPMERIGGRFRYQLMLQSNERRNLNQLLTGLRLELETDKLARKVRWSIDVDPLDFF